ncbi:MAG: glycolate oxidase subunit GlcE [Sulfuricaulis sp.]
MHHNADISQSLREVVTSAAASHTPLAIVGAGTKTFYSGTPPGSPLAINSHRGIISYEPTELVLTARAGTPLADIESALAEKGQLLGFEPPYFGKTATLGGTIACGLSGPRRPYAGSARDFVLGTTIINGQGEILKFGGTVMKNVAGYDVSRLMVGALGTLGVLLEISLKVLPKPAQEITLSFEMPAAQAISTMNAWAGQPLPLSASCHQGDTLYIRLSGTEPGVRAARAKLGGSIVENGDDFWRELREHQHGFFRDTVPLWRLSVPPAAPPIDLPGHWFTDWGGAQRWLKSEAPAETIRRAAGSAGGYATCFRGASNRNTPFDPTAPVLTRLQRNIRLAFDPSGIFNSFAEGQEIRANHDA